MRTLQEYQRHAEECDALAKKALSPEHRDMISQMAETWRMLADQRRRKLSRRSNMDLPLFDKPAPVRDN